jgi:hypothetical protein
MITHEDLKDTRKVQLAEGYYMVMIETDKHPTVRGKVLEVRNITEADFHKYEVHKTRKPSGGLVILTEL